jgi:vanillate O-demethylase ferredoxin subunit
MRYEINWQNAVLRATLDLAPDIRQFEIVPEDGLVQNFAAGSHINVSILIDGRPEYRSYSLISEKGEDCYRIAVKNQAQGRGGSANMWSLEKGARLSVSQPHNLFGLEFGRPDYLLIAGGIGITPLLGMATALDGAGATLRFLYASRTRGDAIFADELVKRFGHRFELFVSQEGVRVDIKAEIAKLAKGGQLYICGPVPLLDEARAAWAEAGRPATDLRFETFGSGGHFAPVGFQIKIPRLGLAIEVGQHQSMLEALTRAGVEVLSDCKRGECGLCAHDIIGGSGEIDHRDVFLSDTEKHANHKICVCVSRVVNGDIVLETAYRP